LKPYTLEDLFEEMPVISVLNKFGRVCALHSSPSSAQLDSFGVHWHGGSISRLLVSGQQTEPWLILGGVLYLSQKVIDLDDVERELFRHGIKGVSPFYLRHIQKNPDLLCALEKVIPKLREYFPDERLSVHLSVDPECPQYKDFFLLAETEKTVEIAMEKMDGFDEWWLDVASQYDSRLNIDFRAR